MACTEQQTKFLDRAKIFYNEEIFRKCIYETVKNYRQDKGLTSYLAHLDKVQDVFDEEYVKSVRNVLHYWNMDQRGAKLAKIETFNKDLRDCYGRIKQIDHVKIGSDDADLILKSNKLEDLAYNLRNLCEQDSKLVTVAKTLHFLAPNFLIPIDRKFTIYFFTNKIEVPKNLDEQIKLYKDIQIVANAIAKRHDFDKYRDSTWNKALGKIPDNAIIGARKLGL